MGPVAHATWGSVDIESLGASWRVLVLDPTATGNAWQDQMFWVPKAASQSSFDHLIVLCSTPTYTLAEAFESESQSKSRELLAAVEAHSGLERIRLVISGTTRTQEAILPAGPWGELWLNAGTSGASGRATQPVVAGPRSTELRLVAGLREELGDGAAPAAWWELQLEGDLASLRMRRAVESGRIEEVWRIHYDDNDGWSRAVE
ncbi:MAG: hypothetical protein KC912_12595 [Proteobacteria bacterium]|nr:hypothetical protein [Pseudomonadota bacterium]